MRLEVSVPGTSANLGPGFDALGLALALRTTVTLEFPTDRPGVRVIGRDSAILGRTRNLVEDGILRYLMSAGRTLPPYALTVDNQLPVARGMGGSAAAAVAGLALGAAALGCQLDPAQLLPMAVEMEGHGDNVAPAIFGGLVLVWGKGEGVRARALPIAESLRTVIFIPEQTSSTKAARAVLPARIPHADAVYNVARAALLVDALREGRADDLREAMSDRLHQPYRLPALPHASMLEAAVAAGAFGAALSGAGSSLLALCDGASSAAVAAAMRSRAAELGVAGEVVPLAIDRRGLVLTIDGVEKRMVGAK
ncbi:MAG: homoserine kinase [Thermomicrobiales bacterium]